jgi:hypothetical protein
MAIEIAQAADSIQLRYKITGSRRLIPEIPGIMAQTPQAFQQGLPT